MFANCVANLVTTVVRVKQFSLYEELTYRIKSLLFSSINTGGEFHPSIPPTNSRTCEAST